MKQLFWTLLFITMGAMASAHSPLKSTEPADAAIIAAVPETLDLMFKSDIRLTRVTLSLDASDEIDLDLGDQTSFTTDFAVTLPDLGEGVYQITWRGLSSDGHAQNGTFAFTVE